MIPILLSTSLAHIAVALIVIGILLWIVNAYIPMQESIKKILNVVVVVCVILWLCREFGLFDFLDDIGP